MIVIDILGQIFVEFIFKVVILRIYNLFKRSFEFIRVKVFGFKAKPINHIERLEKKLLYKNIELTENVNSILKAGEKGAILEVIDKDKVFAEFYDHTGKLIELNNEFVFEIRVKQFKLKNKPQNS